MNSASTTVTVDVPNGWHAPAAALWATGQQEAAFGSLLTELNQHGQRKPTPMVLQLVYYMFQRGDWQAAAGCLTLQHQVDPGSDQVLLNLAVCLSRSGQNVQALRYAQAYVQRRDDDPVVYDVLSNCLFNLGQLEAASEAGTRALALKSARSVGGLQAALQRVGAQWSLPAWSVEAVAARPSVIAFSLWGDQQRYLWGALENLIAAQTLYPGWQVRIHLDSSVPLRWQQQFQALGADLRREPDNQPLRERLCWRFQCASDAGVGRFLVRDIDSVLDGRERAAVDAWIASGRAFHVMRDWWTHTDLMLAGMWGGVAGLLPALLPRMQRYKPQAMETPNIDQWFLRDQVWPLIQADCLVHDRCFHMPDAQAWPGAVPAGNQHVGQNMHAADPRAQFERLKPWLERLYSQTGGPAAASSA